MSQFFHSFFSTLDLKSFIFVVANMSQQGKKINIPKPAGGYNGGGKKRKHDQIASSKNYSKQPLKKMRISQILPKEEAVPQYTPDLKKNSQIIKRELEAQKTRPTKQAKWKKVDVDASKFLLNEGNELFIFFKIYYAYFFD